MKLLAKLALEAVGKDAHEVKTHTTTDPIKITNRNLHWAKVVDKDGKCWPRLGRANTTQPRKRN